MNTVKLKSIIQSSFITFTSCLFAIYIHIYGYPTQPPTIRPVLLKYAYYICVLCFCAQKPIDSTNESRKSLHSVFFVLRCLLMPLHLSRHSAPLNDFQIFIHTNFRRRMSKEAPMLKPNEQKSVFFFVELASAGAALHKCVFAASRQTFFGVCVCLRI